MNQLKKSNLLWYIYRESKSQVVFFFSNPDLFAIDGLESENDLYNNNSSSEDDDDILTGKAMHGK